MVVRCSEQLGGTGIPNKPGCGRLYDDAEQWTICPHGPLWPALGAYCVQHDLVWCHMHGKVEEGAQEAQGGVQDG